ncbi:MAG: hypothetical protein ACKO6N_20495 [Myxococcota bacterium]
MALSNLNAASSLGALMQLNTRLQRTAQQVLTASAQTEEDPQGQQGPEYSRVELKRLPVEQAANLQVIRTQDNMVGTLLNIIA